MRMELDFPWWVRRQTNVHCKPKQTLYMLYHLGTGVAVLNYATCCAKVYCAYSKYGKDWLAVCLLHRLYISVCQSDPLGLAVSSCHAEPSDCCGFGWRSPGGSLVTITEASAWICVQSLGIALISIDCLVECGSVAPQRLEVTRVCTI